MTDPSQPASECPFWGDPVRPASATSSAFAPHTPGWGARTKEGPQRAAFELLHRTARLTARWPRSAPRRGEPQLAFVPVCEVRFFAPGRRLAKRRAEIDLPESYRHSPAANATTASPSSRRTAQAVAALGSGRADDMSGRLHLDDHALAQICARHRIRRLSLFGSVLKGTDRPDSDVDLLVEFEPDASPSFLDLARIEEELSSLLAGRRVDLRTPRELSRYFRDQVMREAEEQYVAG